MTLDHHTAVEEASAAELRGEWSTAYERHRSVPMFAQSHHGGLLKVMVDLGDDAPDWVLARFVTVMAHRLEMHGQVRRSSRVLQHVMPTLYPHGIPWEAMDCEHPEQVPAAIFGQDWVVRQADVFDLGGLVDLLHLPTARGLVDRVPVVREWAHEPMGGWRIERADSEVLRVTDVATGERRRLLDLGVTAQVEVGTHVLGRVVPTETGPGWLFDWRPLPVDETTAALVAEDPQRWLKILAARTADETLAPAFSHLSPTSLTADLAAHSWGVLLGHPVDDDLPRPPRSLAADALRAALLMATDPDAVRRHRHVVAELLLDEALDERSLSRYAMPKYRAAWQVWAAALPAHARKKCETALWLLDAAGGEGLVG